MAQTVFAVGQKWSVRRAAPTTMTAVIGRIETLPGLGRVFHVSVFNMPLRFKGCL
jgi:hypothetical protein